MSLESKVESLKFEVKAMADKIQCLEDFIKSNMVPKTPKILTLKEFAKVVNKAYSTVRRWIAKGILEKESEKCGVNIIDHSKRGTNYLVKFTENK